MAAPRFLVVDEHDRPMKFIHADKQFCYCTTVEYSGDQTPATSYSKEDAESLIKQTKLNRKSWGFKEGQYFLMPFE